MNFSYNNNSNQNNNEDVWDQWCTPVILTTWEAEIGKISSRPPQAKKLQDPISMGKGWAWLHTPVIPAMAGSIKSWSRLAWSKSEIPPPE
jgi:hypothetical protein